MPDLNRSIIKALSGMPLVEVAWLYGSRARGDNNHSSDYDIAIALVSPAVGDLNVLEDIRYSLSGLVEAPVSAVDINKAPTPLALNIISEGKALVVNSDLRLRAEQQRVWSLWEEYKYEHERNKQAL